MSLVNMNEMLQKASKERYAVGSFDIFDLQMGRGVLSAAEQSKSPVIIAHGEAFEPIMPVELFTVLMRKASEMAAVPVALHLDHANNLEVIQRALDNGYTSIMIDASDKPLRKTSQLHPALRRCVRNSAHHWKRSWAMSEVWKGNMRRMIMMKMLLTQKWMKR